MHVLLGRGQVSDDAVWSSFFIEVLVRLTLGLAHEHRVSDIVFFSKFIFNTVKLFRRVVAGPEYLIVDDRSLVPEPVFEAGLEHPVVFHLLGFHVLIVIFVFLGFLNKFDKFMHG